MPQAIEHSKQGLVFTCCCFFCNILCTLSTHHKPIVQSQMLTVCMTVLSQALVCSKLQLFFSSVIVERYLAAVNMKRPACAAAGGHHNKDHQEDGQRVVKTNDEKRKPADCTHPTSMQKASGSNRYCARMTCRACGVVLYHIARPLSPNAPPPKGWEQIWQLGNS